MIKRCIVVSHRFMDVERRRLGRRPFFECTSSLRCMALVRRSASVAPLSSNTSTGCTSLRPAPRNVALRRPKLATPDLPALATLDALSFATARPLRAALLATFLPNLPVAALLGTVAPPFDHGTPLFAPLLPCFAIAAPLATLIGTWSRLRSAAASRRCRRCSARSSRRS
jgi:hypothetical protein